MINHEHFMDRVISLIPIALIALFIYILVYSTGLLFDSNEIIDTLLWLIPLFFLIIF